LVAGPVNTSGAFAGAGVVESVADLCTSLKNGDWLATGLAGVGTVMDVAATVSDPFGSLISAGLGWLMEHLEPLKGWLNDLTGDAGAVLGFAGTWENIAAAMGAAGDELNRVVRADLEAMSGASITAYATYADSLADQIRATGASASAIGSALTTCSMVVQVVHDLVRDTLAQLIGSIISWAAEAIFTVGLATPLIVEQVTTRVSALATKVGRSVTDVITSAKSLKNLLEALKDLLARLGKDLRRKMPGARSIDAPTVHAGDLDIPEPKARTAIDPHTQVGPAVIDHSAPGGHLIPADYDRFGGLTEDEFLAKHWDPDATNDYPPGTTTTGKWHYPPNNGADGTPFVDSRVARIFTPGKVFDRFGEDYGAFVSPDALPFDMRALPPSSLGETYHRYVVLRELDAASGYAKAAPVAPAFGQRGGGLQLALPASIRQLIKDKYLEELQDELQ